MKYGQPTQIDRRYFNSDRAHPHEIWHYNEVQGGVQFVFVDIKGVENYILVNSTAMNEIHNDNWYKQFALPNDPDVTEIECGNDERPSFGISITGYWMDIATLPYSLLKHVAVIIGYIMRYASVHRFDVTVDNLRHAYPDLSHKALHHLAQDTYTSLALTFLEVMTTPHKTDSEIIERFTFANPNRIQEIIQRGSPILFLSGHYGNWEWELMLPVLYSSH